MKSDIKAEVSINIQAPVSKVWDALTKPEIIKQYFFGTDTITDWKVGGPIKFKVNGKEKPMKTKEPYWVWKKIN